MKHKKITAYVTQAEHDELKNAAKQKKMRYSDYLAECLITGHVNLKLKKFFND